MNFSDRIIYAIALTASVLLTGCGGGGSPPAQAQTAGPMPTAAILSGFCSMSVNNNVLSQTAGQFVTGLGRVEACDASLATNPLNLGLPMPSTGTLKNLRVDTFQNGTSAGNGTFVVFVNGSPTSITCAVGTGHVCGDVQHQVLTGPGDVVGVALILQPGEQFSGRVRVTLEKQ